LGKELRGDRKEKSGVNGSVGTPNQTVTVNRGIAGEKTRKKVSSNNREVPWGPQRRSASREGSEKRMGGETPCQRSPRKVF